MIAPDLGDYAGELREAYTVHADANELPVDQILGERLPPAIHKTVKAHSQRGD